MGATAYPEDEAPNIEWGLQNGEIVAATELNAVSDFPFETHGLCAMAVHAVLLGQWAPSAAAYCAATEELQIIYPYEKRVSGHFL